MRCDILLIVACLLAVVSVDGAGLWDAIKTVVGLGNDDEKKITKINARVAQDFVDENLRLYERELLINNPERYKKFPSGLYLPGYEKKFDLSGNTYRMEVRGPILKDLTKVLIDEVEKRYYEDDDYALENPVKPKSYVKLDFKVRYPMLKLKILRSVYWGPTGSNLTNLCEGKYVSEFRELKVRGYIIVLTNDTGVPLEIVKLHIGPVPLSYPVYGGGKSTGTCGDEVFNLIFDQEFAYRTKYVNKFNETMLPELESRLPDLLNLMIMSPTFTMN